jgi:tetratricopeptide (TPR) repeat protein
MISREEFVRSVTASLSFLGVVGRFDVYRSRFALPVAVLAFSLVASGPVTRAFAQKSRPTVQQTVSANQLSAPDKAQKAVARAREALSHGRLEEARAQLDHALAVYPTYALAFAVRGTLRIRENQLEQASSDFEQAIQNDPNLGAGYLGLGATYNLLGRFHEALVPLAQSVEILSDTWPPHFQIAVAYYHTGQYETALRELANAEKIGVSDLEDWAAIRYLNAQVLLKLSDDFGAKDNFQQILARAPKSVAARLSARELHRLLVRIGEFEPIRPAH